MRGSPELLTQRSRQNSSKSASPIAFAKNSHFVSVHAVCHLSVSQLLTANPFAKSFVRSYLGLLLIGGAGLAVTPRYRENLSDQIA
jgi:hypothetical protein